MTMIDLGRLTQNRVRNLTGHERGGEARSFFELDTLDTNREPVYVRAPDDLDAISTSFFQGMFAKSVKHYADSSSFLEHYRFDVEPFIMEQIIRGIDRVETKRTSAFN